MKAFLHELVPTFDGEQRLTIVTKEDCRGLWDDLHDKEVEVTIKRFHKKRSLTANSYMWVLLDKMAQVLHVTKEELYLDYIRRLGMFKDFTLTEDEAKTFRVVWENFGTGWPTEQVDYDADGEKVVIRAYYGSSRYNTKQMGRLIDEVVQDCKDLEIETLPPYKLDALIGAWNG